MSILTIITIHLNDFDGLFKTHNSLKTKLAADKVEWIVIDGGSKAPSIEQRPTLSLVKASADNYVSEPDDGIYDAMNKGTLLATGEYVLYLNAGDELHPEFSCEQLSVALQTHGAGMIWGKADVRDRNQKIYSRKTRNPGWLRYGTAVCHQAVFFKRSLLGSSPYDTRLSIAADYNLICRLYTAGESVKMLAMPVCVFDLVGKSGADKWLTLSEESDVRQKYFSVPNFFNVLITRFKLIIWQTGTLIPSFRRAWSRFF